MSFSSRCSVRCRYVTRPCSFLEPHLDARFRNNQVLQLIWFWMVCRVAYRVVTGKGAEDTRSDDEE